MNGTECRPQAPVGGGESYEGHIGDAPKTLFIFLATPCPLRKSEGGSEIVRVADRGAMGGTDGTGSPGGRGSEGGFRPLKIRRQTI
jgi:hypothetical protein